MGSNTKAALEFVVANSNVPADVGKQVKAEKDIDGMTARLGEADQTPEVTALTGKLNQFNANGVEHYVYNTLLAPLVPKFLYFAEYYQMKGCANIQQLMERKNKNALKPSDHPLLGLINLARIDLPTLLAAGRTQELRNNLQGAGNHLTKKVVDYWSQNKHLRMEFDIREAKPGDPEGMTQGTNVWAEVYDTVHWVSTGLGTRSRGFVWFFSFLAWYSDIKRANEPVILLLDEPGLSLHAKAQEDLLGYFEKELKGAHQVIYTTHSPFMVDADHFERVRIVQDKSIDAEDPLPADEEGTKVLSEVLEATEDSLFPLQGALGYDISQPLFIGPNSLVVEGVSDLLFIQTMRAVVEQAGGKGLDPRWVITPVGGSDKVPTFVALIGAQKLNVATLIDYQKKDRQTIENLYKKKLLKKKQVRTYAEFTGTTEADAEDMFDPDFYVKLVNAEYKNDLAKPVTTADLDANLPRMTQRMAAYFVQHPMKEGMVYNHYRPARKLAESAALQGEIDDASRARFEEAFKQLNALIKK